MTTLQHTETLRKLAKVLISTNAIQTDSSKTVSERIVSVVNAMKNYYQTSDDLLVIDRLIAESDAVTADIIKMYVSSSNVSAVKIAQELDIRVSDIVNKLSAVARKIAS